MASVAVKSVAAAIVKPGDVVVAVNGAFTPTGAGALSDAVSSGLTRPHPNPALRLQPLSWARPAAPSHALH